MDKIKKIILEINFFLSTFRKFTVVGFVNQLIKNSGLTGLQQPRHMMEIAKQSYGDERKAMV